MKKISIFLALLLALCLLSGSALAASKVNFEGKAEKFVFLPGSELSDTDLFENFKGVLPGDTLTQKVTVRNNSGSKVRIWMRAEPVSEADEAFLSQLSLTVDCKNKEIFDAAASETAQLTKNTLLGTFKQGGSTELLVTLNVPIELGNEFMGVQGTVPWTFIAEELPDDTTPHTGDWFQLGLWIALAAGLMLCIFFVLLVMKKRRAQAE